MRESEFMELCAYVCGEQKFGELYAYMCGVPSAKEVFVALCCVSAEDVCMESVKKALCGVEGEFAVLLEGVFG